MGQAYSTTPSADSTATVQSPARCPIDHTAAQKPARCPIDHTQSSVLNPANNMPVLSQSPALEQGIALPIDRVTSSIPRPKFADDAEDSHKWEYPSPQQFYNALVRKGWETPVDSVESMVEIHNWLNEAAWSEVLRWEKHTATPEDSEPNVELARFTGKPGQLSPKARIYLFAGWLLPSRFNTVPPFDRHDWVVKRKSGSEHRYIIDYYEAPPDEQTGEPSFSLDVRPALDSVWGIQARIKDLVGAVDWNSTNRK